MERYQINWTHFTNEERGLIEKIIQQGEYKKITKLVVVSTKEQENEITKFIESITPTGKTRESEIKNQMKMLRMKGEEPILTPEQEAEWQAKLDEEANPMRTAIANETAKLKGELERLKIVFPPTASYEHLKALKEAAESKVTEVVSDPAPETVNSEVVEHKVTAEDMEANPELADDGVKVGDVIELPKVEDEEMTVKPKTTKKSTKK